MRMSGKISPSMQSEDDTPLNIMGFGKSLSLWLAQAPFSGEVERENGNRHKEPINDSSSPDYGLSKWR
jgi:hypothetical protein